MITVPGRLLFGPDPQYGKNRRVKPSQGSWNMAGLQFCKPMVVRKWAFLQILWNERNTLKERLKDLATTFGTEMRNCGMDVPEAFERPLNTISLDRYNTDKHNEALKTQLQGFQAAGVEMLWVVLPTKDIPLYCRLKYLADCVYGMHSAVSVAERLNKQHSLQQRIQYFANIALKFNLKRGGSNQMLSADKLDLIKDGKTMLVGIDVTHPSPGNVEGTPSIAAVVASTDKTCTQWPTSLRVQEGRKETVVYLQDMMIERLQLWRQKNPSLPENIIVYRDGVSEGQYQMILTTELDSINAAIAKLYPPKGKKPKITIVVVGKRHHTRFYPTRVEDIAAEAKPAIGNKPGKPANGNPKNGTVVDRGVTSERQWDFFLQAHHGLQGTARPAHYVVLKDDIKFTANKMEHLVSSPSRFTNILVPKLTVYFPDPQPLLPLWPCNQGCINLSTGVLCRPGG